jgi:hypothetical protein
VTPPLGAQRMHCDTRQMPRGLRRPRTGATYRVIGAGFDVWFTDYLLFIHPKQKRMRLAPDALTQLHLVPASIRVLAGLSGLEVGDNPGFASLPAYLLNLSIEYLPS